MPNSFITQKIPSFCLCNQPFPALPISDKHWSGSPCLQFLLLQNVKLNHTIFGIFGIYWILWICKCVFHQRWKFSTIISSVFFLYQSLCPLLWVSYDVIVIPFLSSHRSLHCAHFIVFYLYCSDIIISIALSSISLNLFSVPSILLLNSSRTFLGILVF